MLQNTLGHSAFSTSDDAISGNQHRWQTFMMHVEDMLGHTLDNDQADAARTAFREGACVVEFVLDTLAKAA